MWIATLETVNFSFTALGSTRQASIDAIVTGLKKHGADHGLVRDWWINNDINTLFLRDGECARDYSVISDARAYDKQPLVQALCIEEARYMLLTGPANDVFDGSDTDCLMSQQVLELCGEGGLDLEDDGGYCNKATPIEIANYNLDRIRRALKVEQ